MPVERWPITNRDQWLEWRKRFITASRVGAIQGADPYCSPLRLYIEKGGHVELPEVPDSGVMRRGRWFENAVETALAELRPDWTLRHNTDFYVDTTARLAATPDYFIEGDPRGLGVLQVKTVDPRVFKRDWADGPPFRTVLQTLTEAMLSESAFGAIAGLVFDSFDPQCPVFEFDRHPAAEQRIFVSVAQFWDDLANGREPGPDYGLDRALILALSPIEKRDELIDLSTDNEIISGLCERADTKRRMKVDKDRCEAIETMVMSRMREAAIARVPDFRVTWKTEKRRAYSVAEKSRRVLRITDQRPGREDDEAE